MTGREPDFHWFHLEYPVFRYFTAPVLLACVTGPGQEQFRRKAYVGKVVYLGIAGCKYTRYRTTTTLRYVEWRPVDGDLLETDRSYRSKWRRVAREVEKGWANK